jgi:transketolase
MNIEPLAEKWASFGWEVREIDGHDYHQIDEALRSIPFTPGKPSVIIAKTIKGKGLPIAENKVEWHHKVPNEREYQEMDKLLGLGSCTP